MRTRMLGGGELVGGEMKAATEEQACGATPIAMAASVASLPGWHTSRWTGLCFFLFTPKAPQVFLT